MLQGLLTLCTRFGFDYTDELETAYELACITADQVDRDPHECLAKLQAAMEDC